MMKVVKYQKNNTNLLKAHLNQIKFLNITVSVGCSNPNHHKVVQFTVMLSPYSKLSSCTVIFQIQFKYPILFWIFHINRMIQYVFFCVWLLSRFIHVIQHVSVLYFFLLVNSIPVYHFLSICWQTFEPFPAVSCCVQCCYEHVYMYLFEYLFSVLLGVYLAVELLGHIVILCLTFEKPLNWF